MNLNVATGFYQGLLGRAISKDDKTNKTYVFLYYTDKPDITTSINSSDNINSSDLSNPELGHKLYRYELVSEKLINPKLLLQLPYTPGPEDNGGHITIGLDNNLYLIIGNVMDDKGKS